MITRRAALAAGVGGVAAVLLGATAEAADDTVPTFVIDPSGGCVGMSCVSCSACIYHAANKLFTTEQAALANLAHPGCHCVVVPGPALLQSVYDVLFAGGATAVDRRWDYVADALVANGNQRSVPMFGGVAPIGVVVGGVAVASWWATRSPSDDATRVGS